MKKMAPVTKNEMLEVLIEDLTHEGAGVAKVDGFPIFVPNTLPGEKAKIKVIKVNKGYGFGRLMEIMEDSPYRVEIQPEDFSKYGGCQLQHMSYKGQLTYKEKQVREVMARIGKLEDVVVHPVLGMEKPTHYRNKAQVPVGEKDGKLIAGFFKPRTHEIVDTEESIIQHETINEAVQTVKEIFSRLGIPAYDEATHKGVLRHIMARYGKQTGELMIVLVTRTNSIPFIETIIKELAERLPNLKSIVQNVNTKKTNVILGDKMNLLWGSEVIYDMIDDVKFAISANSFYQVNPDQTKVLYNKALEYAGLTGEETVIDAYCGIGTISLFLAKKAKSVLGVEVVDAAIEDARRNAELNNITNAEFMAGDAGTVIAEWYQKGNSADVIVVDPPRKGCEESLLRTIIEMKPKRVVYVSCNPGTLARDLHLLEEGGYKTTDIQPVDMFPMTTHVESVAQLILNV